MTDKKIDLRPIVLSDAALIHAWRNHPSVRAMSYDSKEIDFEKHVKWLEGSLKNPHDNLLMGIYESVPVGVIRFVEENDVAIVSVYLAPEHTGKGLGPSLLISGNQWVIKNIPHVTTLKASIKINNVRSQKAFLSVGYTQNGDSFDYKIRQGN